MKTVLDDLDLAPLVIRLEPAIHMTADQFFEFCQINRDWRMERTVQGDILIMAPAGGEASSRNLELSAQLRNWAKRDGSGVAFDSSAGFTLPDGATRSPDAAWVRKARLKNLTAEQKQKFLPLCPDLVVELLSPSDRLSTAQDKMQEYLENGAQLGWLIDPKHRRVYVYRPGVDVQCLEDPETLPGEPLLSGFLLDLKEIWEPGF